MAVGRNTAVALHLRLALAAIALTLTFGALTVLHYVPALSVRLQAVGLGLPSLRPLHTTFAHTWIYAANLAMIYYFLSHQRSGGLDAGDRRRFVFHSVCWIVGGGGVLVTLLAGVTSGREYLGFHPLFSAMFLMGWIAFGWTFFKYIWRGFWHRPVYVYMWAIGVLYFVYTFSEAHAYLLPFVNRFPVVDLQLQWKSAGTLVGSFNFLVYGSLMYLAERLSGDDSYGQSRIAFLLFGVGCLNSFTNFAHHTYHIPQTPAVKWISFVVSMMEIIVVLRVMSDILKMRGVKTADGAYTATGAFLTSAKWWTAAMVFGGLVISIPSWNAIIHGTHVVVGHAMGAELGIDSMVLFGVVTFLLLSLYPDSATVRQRIDSVAMRRLILVLNAATASLVAWLMLSGTYAGILRYHQRPTPEWLAYGPFVLVASGFFLAASLVALLMRWGPLLIRPRNEGHHA
ncbi:MAG: cbb3-type cytochrome c oxidase subunit I [Gemmatimonadetes bacterium]|nr:cbb3-type cytochrome c oxidase subunit I [Gemmatimonadota bacterium]